MLIFLAGSEKTLHVMDNYQHYKKNHLTMLKTRKQVLSIKTAAEWLLTENSVPVSVCVCVCYPLSLCMCVSLICPEHSDGIISQSVGGKTEIEE